MSVARRNCDVLGCDRESWAQGYCLAHYKRVRKHGDPNAEVPLRGGSPMDRFFQKVHKAASGCWEWTGCIGDNGYGQFRDGRLWKAHRWLFVKTVGEVAVGLDLDHLCRNRACVNPDHLEAVSRSENLRRGAAVQRWGAQCQ